MTSVVGVLLAAGSGERFGGPKALARDDDGTSWLLRSVQALRPCTEVVVVLGAESDTAAELVPDDARIVIADDWRRGMGASLAAGIAGLPDGDAVLITLVDLPEMPPSVPERLLEHGATRDVVARAVYAGVPGHPVLLGREHWAAFAACLHGDEGGKAYLSEHAVKPVECSDLFSGHDVDTR